MDTKKCPIKLDSIHCQNCYFMKGECKYNDITKSTSNLTNRNNNVKMEVT